MKGWWTRGATALVLVVAASAVAPPARAVFHFINIVEVFVGTAEYEDAHYVELQMYSSGQTAVSNHSLQMFGPDGTSLGTYTFTTSVDNGANQATILAASPLGEEAFDVSADLEIGAVLQAEGGKVCFDTVDCVAWGTYTGSSAGVGTPFAPNEGIASGASIHRDVSGGTDPTKLDFEDDTDDSDSDFAYRTPSPKTNANVEGVPPGAVIGFDRLVYEGAEGGPGVSVTVGRTGATPGGTFVDVIAADTSASQGSDYSTVDRSIEWQEGNTGIGFHIEIFDDGDTEGVETARLTLRNPTGGAVLSRPDAKLDIADNDGAVSSMAKPEHDASYRRGRFTKMRGTASASAGIDKVQVGLRKTMRDGSCRWWNGSNFVVRSCDRRLFENARGGESWTYALPFLLDKSVGTQTKFYTGFARAIDSGGNREITFETGRNANRFEII